MGADDLQSRIARVEAELAELRRAHVPGTVRASRVELADAAGNVRALLEVSERGPCLTLMDERGQPGATLLLSPEGPGLTMADARGETRLWLGVTNNAARLAMADEQGKQRVYCAAGRAGPTLDFYDDHQRSVWTALPRG